MVGHSRRQEKRHMQTGKKSDINGNPDEKSTNKNRGNKNVDEKCGAAKKILFIFKI